MRTAIDASILWCLLKREPAAAGWISVLTRAAMEGELVICPVAWAEIASYYATPRDGMEDLERLAISYDPISPEAAWKAAQIFKGYRKAGGPQTA